MTKHLIKQVQDFLTVVDADFTYQILPVEVLLMQHSPEKVAGFLNLLRQDYKKELRGILKENKTHRKINHLVVLNFRLKMAINTIKNAKQEEVKREQGDEAEQRAASSGGFSRRHMLCDCDPRQRQNADPFKEN
jgi:hypothetical protein